MGESVQMSPGSCIAGTIRLDFRRPAPEANIPTRFDTLTDLLERLTMQTRASLMTAFLVLAVVSLLLGTVMLPQSGLGGEQNSVPTDEVNLVADPDLVPVEEDMHEFMEYVFQPTYKRLKVVMAEAPADNNGWKAIKADALSLAEAANLIIMRPPENDAKDWNAYSIDVRNHGKTFYTAARAKDFPSARKSYEAMLQSCNACHKQFENGKHILTP